MKTKQNNTAITIEHLEAVQRALGEKRGEKYESPVVAAEKIVETAREEEKAKVEIVEAEERITGTRERVVKIGNGGSNSSYIGEVKSDEEKRWDEIFKELNKNGKGELNPISTALRILGGVAGGVINTVITGLKQATGIEQEDLMNVSNGLGKIWRNCLVILPRMCIKK